MQKKNCIGLILLFFVIFVNFNLGREEIFAKATDQSVKIDIDYCDENTSKPDILYWGSEVGLSAKISSDTGVEWKILNDGSKDIEVSTMEYCNSEGESCIRVYAPFGYCDELTITAIAEDDESNFDTYSLKIEDGTKWNGRTFFEFDMNVPEEKQLDGEAPQIEEQWDVGTQKYTIVLPDIFCRVDGYTFVGWKDKNGKLYQPKETLSVTYGDTVYYTIYAEWEKNNSSVSQTVGHKEEVEAKNRDNTTLSKFIFLGVIIGIVAIVFIVVVIRICIHRKREKGQNKGQ